MPKKTRPRIDKKNAITFKLVSRSQKDPLIADETAPQHVLIPANIKKKEAEYGIYYDDDYDYLKHLKSLEEFKKPGWDLVPEIQKKMVKKSSQNKPKIMLPSSVFPSLVQEKEGMLSKAVLPVGPQPDWDPDIVAALDDDFDYDDPNNKLDDDFVAQAMASDDEDNEETHQNQKKYNSDSDDDYFYKDETKSVFTNYTMTSSVLPRNKGLTYIDQHFETLYEKEYTEDNDCAFDSDEDGIDPNECELIQHLVMENEKAKSKVQVSDDHIDTLKLIEKLENCSDEDLEEIHIDNDNRKDKENKWDCESIISTYSNLYNHPKLICEEKSLKCPIDRKTGLPTEFVDKGITKRRLKQLDHLYEGRSEKSIAAFSRISELSFRPDNETPEERKQRKNALKEYRRERRLEKKANKVAFKLESEKQKREMLNIKNSLNSMKLI